MKNHQICTQCIMDTTDPDIVFTNDGICNHCFEYETLIGNDEKYSEDEYNRIIKKIKKRGKGHPYDCIAAISGGIDSSYMVHRLKSAGLRVLAVHFDGGWNTEEAIHNVKSLVETIGIDLYTYYVDWEEFKALQLAYLNAGVIDIDVPTDHTFFAALYEVADMKNVPFIITGHNLKTESLMPKAWICDKLDARNIRDIYKKFGNGLKLKTLPILSFRKKILYYNIKKIEMIFILNTLKYNKLEAAQNLKDTYGWLPVKVKHGESIWTRFYQCYILPTRFNIDKRKAHYSNLILSGLMSRENALIEMQKPIYPYNFEDDKKYILDKFRLTETDLNMYMTQKKRSVNEFKTDTSMKNIYTMLRKLIFFKGLLNASTRH